MIFIQGTTNKYLNALTTTSPNEITLTLSSHILNGSLINNIIDISKLKTSYISTRATANSLVQRDASGNIAMNALSLTSLTTSGTITTTLGSITSNYGMYNFNQPLYNGSTLAQIGTSQFTGNGRFDGALEVFGAFSAYGNANFSGTTIQFITRPTFLTALSIGSAGIGNATGVPTISTLTLGNQAGKQGVIKLEDGSSSYPYGANYI